MTLNAEQCNVQKMTAAYTLQPTDIALHGKIFMMMNLDSLSAMQLLLVACHARTDQHWLPQMKCSFGATLPSGFANVPRLLPHELNEGEEL